MIVMAQARHATNSSVEGIDTWFSGVCESSYNYPSSCPKAFCWNVSCCSIPAKPPRKPKAPVPTSKRPSISVVIKAREGGPNCCQVREQPCGKTLAAPTTAVPVKQTGWGTTSDPEPTQPKLKQQCQNQWPHLQGQQQRQPLVNEHMTTSRQQPHSADWNPCLQVQFHHLQGHMNLPHKRWLTAALPTRWAHWLMKKWIRLLLKTLSFRSWPVRVMMKLMQCSRRSNVTLCSKSLPRCSVRKRVIDEWTFEDTDQIPIWEMWVQKYVKPPPKAKPSSPEHKDVTPEPKQVALPKAGILRIAPSPCKAPCSGLAPVPSKGKQPYTSVQECDSLPCRLQWSPRFHHCPLLSRWQPGLEGRKKFQVLPLQSKMDLMWLGLQENWAWNPQVRVLTKKR